MAMTYSKAGGTGEGETPRERRRSRPLDPTKLEELALAYVARFATSAAKLERYLVRKLRERGWDGQREPDLAALVGRYVALGYIDDAAYARSKGGSLLRRGYGPRRVRQALAEAGIGEATRAEARASAAAERRAALALARKRGFGPFGPAPAATQASVHPVSGLEVIPLTITTLKGPHRFRVEMARTPQQQAQGLMFRTAMGPDEGMLFPY